MTYTKNVKGYITVYLALSLGLVITFLVTILGLVRNQTIRFETECVMDLGLNSAMAEYHREMLKQYGMLFVDCAYGGTSGSPDNTKSHILHYMNMNMSTSPAAMILAGRDITELRADNCELSEVTYASDNRGEVFRYQIDRYMKTLYGMNLIDHGIESIENLDEMYGDYDSYAGAREAYDGEVDEIIAEYNEALPEDEEPYSINNPADSVETLSSNSALGYAINDVASLPLNSTDIEQLISHRSYRSGAGLTGTQESPNSLISKKLFYDYIFKKCGYYREEKENSKLSYQIEYLIAGKSNDLANMNKIAGDIFKTRYAINMAYLITSSDKQLEAEELAAAATIVIGSPELADAVKWSIIFAWGYAESAKDMRILYDGNKLSLFKSDDSWNTPLYQLVDFKLHLGEYSAPDGSVGYEEYLKGFLLMQDIDTVTMRLMDICEMDIRETPGNGSFCFDNLIYQFNANVNVSSKYGYGCSIMRYGTYE